MSRLKLWASVGLALCAGWSSAEEGMVPDRGYSFERGTRHDLENGVRVVDEEKKDGYDKNKKAEAERNARAVAMHVQNLSDPDEKIRETSAEMLGYLTAVEAIPNLIEALNDQHINVQIKAHGALNKITGENFGYKNYAAWKKWWMSNSKEFLAKQQAGVSQLNETRGMYMNTLGLEALKSAQFAQATRMFQEAVNADPKIPDYRNNLGLALMEQGRPIDAINYFQEALGLNDRLPQPYMNIGSCFARLNRHIEAQHWYRKAMLTDKEGKLWEPFWTLGKEFLRKGSFPMAMEFLEQAQLKAQKNNIFDPRIYRDLALTYYGLDQYYSAWIAVNDVKRLGYELDEGFVKKVRQALIAQGYDPDNLDPMGNPGSPSPPAGATPRETANSGR